MVDYAGLSGRGALLLTKSFGESKKGRQQLAREIEGWLSIYGGLDGQKKTLAPHQLESLEYLRGKLQEKVISLIATWAADDE